VPRCDSSIELYQRTQRTSAGEGKETCLCKDQRQLVILGVLDRSQLNGRSFVLGKLQCTVYMTYLRERKNERK
jgi:hypothetical protein